MKAAYEVHNPSFNDIPLDQQIEYGINDWCAEGRDGHPYFGRTKIEAEALRASFNRRSPFTFKYDAPFNPEFLGAQRPRLGEDY